jgi:hypothetical protein
MVRRRRVHHHISPAAKCRRHRRWSKKYLDPKRRSHAAYGNSRGRKLRNRMGESSDSRQMRTLGDICAGAAGDSFAGFVREIVRAHGGDVEFRSQAGDTVSTVRLPRESGAPVLPAAA